jgi:hypothetical protein
MKMVCVGLATVFTLCNQLSADTIVSATGSFSSFSMGPSIGPMPYENAATPPASNPSVFWNNYSIDSSGGNHQMNVGYLLTDTGGFAGTPSVIGSDSVTESLTTSAGAPPSAFNLVRNAIAYNITILSADSSLDTGNSTVGTVFGYYVGGAFQQLWAVGATDRPTGTQAFNPTAVGNSYGFYATVCYHVEVCETYTTGNGNWGNETGGARWNHFALFQLASGNYVIGFEDTNGIYSEGWGDYNDVVIGLSTVTVPVPEPGTMGVVAAGFSALVLLNRRRSLRKFVNPYIAKHDDRELIVQLQANRSDFRSLRIARVFRNNAPV